MVSNMGFSQKIQHHGAIAVQKARTYASEAKQKFNTKVASLQDIASNKVALKKLGFKVTSGAEKVVILPNEKLRTSGKTNPGKVYFVPVRKWGFSKKASLKKEMAKMQEIKSRAGQDGIKNLAVDSKVVGKNDGIEFRDEDYIIEVDAAKCDFEHQIRDSNTDIKERFNLGKDLVSGINELHKADFAYGDIKPENCLVFEKDGKMQLKISDFGKAEEAKDYESKTYKGNLRFAPPEGKLSKKGDVFSAALVLIRNFEEGVLDKDGEPLLSVKSSDLESVQATKERRGIEKLIVNHKAFMGIDEPNISDKLFRRLPRWASMDKLSFAQKDRQQTILSNYVNILGGKLIEKGVPKEGVDELCELLKDMTDANPATRPNMEEVAKRYDTVMEKLGYPPSPPADESQIG